MGDDMPVADVAAADDGSAPSRDGPQDPAITTRPEARDLYQLRALWWYVDSLRRYVAQHEHELAEEMPPTEWLFAQQMRARLEQLLASQPKELAPRRDHVVTYRQDPRMTDSDVARVRSDVYGLIGRDVARKRAADSTPG